FLMIVRTYRLRNRKRTEQSREVGRPLVFGGHWPIGTKVLANNSERVRGHSELSSDQCVMLCPIVVMFGADGVGASVRALLVRFSSWPLPRDRQRRHRCSMPPDRDQLRGR